MRMTNIQISKDFQLFTPFYLLCYRISRRKLVKCNYGNDEFFFFFTNVTMVIL